MSPVSPARCRCRRRNRNLPTDRLLLFLHPAYAVESRAGDDLDALFLQLIDKKVDADGVARVVACYYHIHLVLLCFLAVLFADVHADKRADAGGGEFFLGFGATAGAAGHVPQNASIA